MKIGYARVSTTRQCLDLQMDALEKAGCEKIFFEKQSGANRDRPELKSALDYARCGDSIVVWKLDRLARSMSQLISTIDGLEKRGIEFVSLNESIDTNTAVGKLIFHVFAGLAEFERGITTERIKAGIEAAQSRGKVCGRRRIVSEQKITIAKTMLKDDHISVKEVCDTLGFSVPSFYLYVKGGRGALKDGVA